MIAELPVFIAPYAFAAMARGCYAHAPTAMDRRHVFLLNAILRCYPFKNALEIGSFMGASATAFVEAINSGEGLGAGGIATFCDVCVTDSLCEVARNCRDINRVRVTMQPSWMVLDKWEDFDFIFVDAAHDLDSVSLEVKKLLRRKPVCIMAHDTSATANGYSHCEGAAYLAETFRGLPDYQCIEDNEKRSGEMTDRGLFFATTDAGIFNAAQMIFRQWGR